MTSPLERIGAGLALALLLSAAAGAAQAPQDNPAQPTFRAGINFVRVDVIVSDSRTSQPVLDLQPADFEVTEDGKSQSIESFKLVTLDGGRAEAREQTPRPIRNAMDEEQEAAREDVRLFAIFLDDFGAERQSSARAREPLARFVETELGPSDMIGVMYPLQLVSSIRWTRNRVAVAEAVRSFGGRRGNAAVQSDLRTWNGFLRPDAVRASRQQISLSAIKALVSHMGSIKEGRKTLILVSGGFSYAQLPSRGFGTIDQRGAALSGIAGMQGDLREIWDAANRNNVSIYPVDPRGMTGPAFSMERDGGGRGGRQAFGSQVSLQILAEQTDGRAIVNRNSLAAGMTQIVRDMSAYYLLGYSPTVARTDGQFHQISVRVKRPGVDVRARKGYWALSAEDVERMLAGPAPAPSRAVESALAAIDQPYDARAIRTWVGMARGENGRTRVTFVWEPKPRVPGDRPGSNPETPSRVSLVGVGSDGVPFFTGDLPVAAAPSGHAADVTFEALPGRMQLRLSVEGSGSRMIDAETRVIDVPALSSPRVALGTPRVLRARTFREWEQIKGDANAKPVATREFSRTDRVIVRVPVYGLSNSTPALTVRLLNPAGRAMTELGAVLSAAADAQDIEIPVGAMAPGDYLVEIKAGEGEAAPEVVGFRVVP